MLSQKQSLIILKSRSSYRLFGFLQAALLFLLFTNLFTGLCAVFLCMASEKLVLGMNGAKIHSLHYFIFGSTLWVYNLHYLVKKAPMLLSDRYRWMQQNRSWNYVFLIFGSLLSISSAVQMPLLVAQLGVLLSIITFAYFMPFLPFKNKRRLKDFGWLKIMLLATIWTLVTIAFPVLYQHQSLEGYAIEIVQRFIFLFILCLAFDMRDIQVDLKEGILTIPNTIGLSNTYRLIVVLIVVLMCFSLIQYRESVWLARFLLNIFSAALTLAALYYVRGYSSDRYYLLFLDGQMLLYGLLSFFCSSH